MTRRLAVVASSLAIVFVSPEAIGQELRASPFRGALVPAGAVAGDADGTAVELNPGQLGLLQGASWAVVANHWADDALRAGRGEALLFGAPLFFGSAAGLGLQHLRPTLADEPEAFWKLQIGYSFRLTRGAALGVSWERLFGDRYDGRDSFTVGLGWRLHQALALGLAVRDLNRPRPSELEARLPRTWEWEVALRPLGSHRLEIALGARTDEGDGRSSFRPRARISAHLAPAVGLFAEVDSARDERAPVDAGADRPPATWQALAGLQVGVGRASLSAAGVADLDDAGERRRPGASLVLRGLPARRPALITPRHVEKVVLRDLESETTFLSVVVRLRRLADDKAAAAVLLDIHDLKIGLGRVQELRTLVELLRKKKPVFALLSQPDTRDYYLASAADRIMLHPAGMVALLGLSQTVVFYRDALDRLGVNVDLVRVGEYKGALEPFVMTEHSEPVRQNRNALLDDHYQQIVSDVARGRAGRKLDEVSVRALLDRALFSPHQARGRGLVDAVADEKEAERKVQEILRRGWPVRSGRPLGDPAWVPARVAVVLIEGSIVDGPERGLPWLRREMAWSDRIVAALDRVRSDRSIKALVLRVNSPGGSAFASDRIARAVARVRESGKPIVVSMGDVAASGGYYVAAPADAIFASPGTVTGSIGIFGYKLDLQTLADRVGLGVETFTRGQHADMSSLFRPWTEEERRLIERQLEVMYRQFLETIAKGRADRGLTVARADELGRGRVYTGAQAHAVRLVDRLGGLSDAIDEAARRGRVPRGPGDLPALIVLPPSTPSPLEALLELRGLEADATPDLWRSGGAPARRLLAPLLLGRGSGIEARMPYDLEVR